MHGYSSSQSSPGNLTSIRSGKSKENNLMGENKIINFYISEYNTCGAVVQNNYNKFDNSS